MKKITMKELEIAFPGAKIPHTAPKKQKSLQALSTQDEAYHLKFQKGPPDAGAFSTMFRLMHQFERVRGSISHGDRRKADGIKNSWARHAMALGILRPDMEWKLKPVKDSPEARKIFDMRGSRKTVRPAPGSKNK